jgi:MGT family glycosyltransferase
MYDGDTVAICPPTLDTAVPPRGRRHLLRPVPLPARSRSSSTPETVYFSLGTMWADVAVVQSVLDALADLPLRVVATLGNLDAAQLSAPSRVELHTFVPQEEILPDASLVIHHAGAGTMFGALAHGLPQLALPQAADNFVNAQMLADAGPGIVLMPGEVTPAAVRHAVERLLDEPGFAHSAQAIAAEIASMPGPDEVATALAL